MNTNQPKLGFISGCQRSGTTLLKLILGTHSQISILDENEYDFPFIPLPDQIKTKYLFIKAPNFSNLMFLNTWNSSSTLIWIVRNPVDVVFSMMTLEAKKIKRKWNLIRYPVSFIQYALKKKKLDLEYPWVYACAPIEIVKNLNVLKKYEWNIALIKELEFRYNRIFKKNFWSYSKEELISIGAICWRIKNEMFKFLKANSVDHYFIEYENLIENTKTTLESLMKYLDLEVEDIMFNHHTVYSGYSIGETNNEKPITNEIGKGEIFFNDKEIQLIQEISFGI